MKKAVLAVASLFLAPAVGAVPININLGIVSLKYSSTEQLLYDANASAGGNAKYSEGTPTAVSLYQLDGALVGMLFNDVLDVRLAGVDLAYAGGADTSISGRFDLLNKGAVDSPSFGVGLEASSLSKIEFTQAIDGSQMKLAIQGLDPDAVFVAQNLPFGLQLDPNQPIGFSFTSTSVTRIGTPDNFTLFIQGSGTISGEALEVPDGGATAILLGLGMLGAAGVARMPRKH